VSAEIKVRDHGPYRVSGDFQLVDAEGRQIDVEPHTKNGTIVLCRCGESKTKPFCDQSHVDAVCFRDEPV
jgi:CDGSH-type Zn-finger protein